MVTLKPYQKLNGELMFYINDSDRGVTLGYGKKIYTSKLTKGQKNLYSKFFRAYKKCIATIEDFKELEDHKEKKYTLESDLVLYLTDAANVAGHNVGADGLYIAYKGKLVSFDDLREALNAKEEVE